jgi:[NiFe] hydrogenase diaphorase moiety large subunit
MFPIKYVICNADEGEPGTFKDREILTKVPFKVLASMAICGYIIGAKQGFIYLRGEYKFLRADMEKSIEEFEYYCNEIHFPFKITIFMGSGAYICGEETALFESMEGKRGEPRNKPPFPTQNGYNNLPTLSTTWKPWHTPLPFLSMVQKSFTIWAYSFAGTKLFSVSGDTPKPGIYELELGMSLADFVEEFGDGDTKAVQVGGASGFLFHGNASTKQPLDSKENLPEFRCLLEAQ